MHPALFYLPDARLSLTELCAARLDGHVVEVGEGYMPTDTVETPAARMASIAPILTSRWVAFIGPTAAWLHGAGDRPPHMHHVQRAVSRRIRVPAHPRVHFHDSALDPDSTVRISGIALTIPLRTMSDLARGAARHPAYRHWARALLRVDPALAIKTRAELQSRKQAPGKLAGLRLLDELTTT